MADDGLTEGERMMRRAQGLAMGLADAGLSQAEEMLRRVSPEGRAQAKRERRARARRRNRIIGQVVIVALVALSLLILLAMMGLPPAVGFAVAAAALAGGVALMGRRRAGPRAEALATTDLTQLPAQASAWLGTERKALPAPAVRLADSLSTRLDELQPQLARLSPQEPAAEAVRKLVATELPGLVDGWKAVPPSLRRQSGATGRTPDAQLVDGLKLIDTEVARMTEQLARGALDEVATQERYLKLKYRGEGELEG